MRERGGWEGQAHHKEASEEQRASDGGLRSEEGSSWGDSLGGG